MSWEKASETSRLRKQDPRLELGWPSGPGEGRGLGRAVGAGTQLRVGQTNPRACRGQDAQQPRTQGHWTDTGRPTPPGPLPPGPLGGREPEGGSSVLQLPPASGAQLLPAGLSCPASHGHLGGFRPRLLASGAQGGRGHGRPPRSPQRLTRGGGSCSQPARGPSAAGCQGEASRPGPHFPINGNPPRPHILQTRGGTAPHLGPGWGAGSGPQLVDSSGA